MAIGAMMLYTADQLFNGERGIITWRVMSDQIQNLRAENAQLEADIARLGEHIARLKEMGRAGATMPVDKDFLDELLRRDLGLIKPGEVVILVEGVSPTQAP